MDFFSFYLNLDRTICKQTVETLIRRRVLWRLVWVLHGLPTSNKKDARYIWVKSPALVALASASYEEVVLLL